MVDALTSITLTPGPLGSQIDILWVLPATLPNNYKVYLFKRRGADVDQTNDINRYFTNIADLTNYDYQGLMVFDTLSNNITVLGDYVVLNDSTYYYKAVIRDEDTGDVSTAIGGNATPNSTIITDVLDGKDITAQAIKKTFDSLKDKEGNKVSIGKDIDIVKGFQTGVPNKDTIMIERINGANNTIFWGNILQQIQGNTYMGDYDNAVFRVTYLTPTMALERREKITMIFLAQKQTMISLIKKLGADNANITVESDYYNPMMHDMNCIGVTMIVAMILENKVKVPGSQPTSHQFTGEVEI